MPLVTFLVEVELDDVSPQSLAMDAGDIHDACEAAGLPVTSVKPWSRPSFNPGGPATLPGGQPPPTTNTTQT